MKSFLIKRLLGLAFILIFIISGITNVFATTYEVSDKTNFLNKMNTAKDGDVVKLTSDIALDVKANQKGDYFIIPTNCLVTLDLNGHKISGIATLHGDVFGVRENSALLIKNGTIQNIDTEDSDSGIIILNNVTVTSEMTLGNTQAWIVNNSSILYILSTENGSVNPGANDLHPITTKQKTAYNYENPAPAMIGSGVTWAVYGSLHEDFTHTDSSTYKNVIFLQNAKLTSDSNLTASGITVDLAGYKLETDGHLKISNESGTNIIRNGLLEGNIDLTTGSGNVSISDMTITGNIQNNNHTISIDSGHYNNINGGNGKVTITDGYYKGTLTGNSYEISGGHYVNRPDPSYLKNGCIVIGKSVTSNGVTYPYEVTTIHDVNLHKNGGTINSGDITFYLYGIGAILPTDVMKEGYLFKGWFDNSNFLGSAITEISATDRGSKEYWAKWERNPGKVEIIDVTENADMLNTTEEIKDLIELTSEEKTALNNGKNIYVFLEVDDISDSVSAFDRTLIDNKLDKNSKVGMYLDINLFKQIEGENKVKISETTGKIKILLEIPENLRKLNKEYYIIRVHDGEATKITPDKNGNILIFETDKFSTYALAYTDMKETTVTDNNVLINPKTDDNIMGYASILIISAICLAGGLIYIKIYNNR